MFCARSLGVLARSHAEENGGAKGLGSGLFSGVRGGGEEASIDNWWECLLVFRRFVSLCVAFLLSFEHQEEVSLLIFPWVRPTTLSDCRSHVICGLGCGVSLNGIFLAVESVSASIHEGA